MLRSALVVLIVVVVLLTMLWLGQRKLIYFPSTAPVAAIPGVAEVALHTSDGLELGAWLVAPTAADRRVAVLVANGNAGDRSMRLPLARALAAEGLTVLLFDYRGYAANPGSPSESGFYRDVRAAWRHLTDVAGFAPERIILYGESLGAAVVVDLATEHTPGGLVLRSPFVDLPTVGAHHYPFLPVRLLLKDRFPVAEKLSRVPAPAVIVFGGADSIVPPEQSRRVAQGAGGTVDVVEVPGADHNDYALLAGEQLITAVITLAARIAAG